MKTETRPEIVGVGAFIVDEDNPDRGFIAVQELVTKRRTNKFAGMFSYPMETVEPGESHEQALQRLFQEEICIQPQPALLKLRLGEFFLPPGVSLHTYIFEIGSEATVATGSMPDEVRGPRWTSFQEVFEAPLGRFRAGVYETVKEYLRYLQDPLNFKTKIHVRLRDQIPEEVSNFIEDGSIKIEPLSQHILPQRFFVKRDPLVHL